MGPKPQAVPAPPASPPGGGFQKGHGNARARLQEALDFLSGLLAKAASQNDSLGVWAALAKGGRSRAGVRVSPTPEKSWAWVKP